MVIKIIINRRKYSINRSRLSAVGRRFIDVFKRHQHIIFPKNIVIIPIPHYKKKNKNQTGVNVKNQ